MGPGGRGLVGSMSNLHPAWHCAVSLTPELVSEPDSPFPGGERVRAGRARGVRLTDAPPRGRKRQELGKSVPTLTAPWEEHPLELACITFSGFLTLTNSDPANSTVSDGQPQILGVHWG